MLAVGEKMRKQFHLRRVRRAHQRRVIVGERHVGDAAVGGVGDDGIDGCRHLGAGDGAALASLDAQADDDDAHTRPAVIRPLLDRVHSASDVGAGDREVAADLAFERGGERAEDGGGDLAAVGDHGERGIGEQRVAGADGVDHALDEAVDDEEGAQRVVLARPAGQHAAVAELEHEDAAGGEVVELRRERADAGILVGHREPRLALVGRDQVEALEVEDVAPAARHLAVGDAEGALAGSPRSGSERCAG